MLGLPIAIGAEIVSPGSMTGGETDEERKIREEAEAQLRAGYTLATQAEMNKYKGPTGEKIKRLQEIQDVLDSGILGQGPGDIETYNNFMREMDLLEGQIEQDLKYTPSYWSPTTEYDVEGYDPSSYTPMGYTPKEATAQSESFWAKLDPDRFDVPEYEAAAMQDESQAALARADEGGMAAQREALSGMQDIYKQGGLTAIDKARLEESRRRNQQIERASREAILADMERRGQAGSGVELAARLANQQGAAERMAQEALGVEGMAQQRAERALGAASGMGQQLAEDVYRRGYQTGSAADEINRFNTQGARDVQEATRGAQDEEVGWQRDTLMRDVDRLANTDRYNTVTANEAQREIANQWTDKRKYDALAQAEADRWNAANLNAMNQWGANAQNTAGQWNTGQQNLANLQNVQNAYNQMGLQNQALGNIGNLSLQYGQQRAGSTAQIPPGDFGQFMNNAWNIDQAIGNEVMKGMSYGMGGQGGAMNTMMGGQPITNPIQTGQQQSPMPNPYTTR